MSQFVDQAIKVAEKDNYLNKDIQYIKNVSIVEYDISAAGLSTLTHHKLVSKNKLDELRSLDKITRNIKIGLILRDNPELNDVFSKSLKEVRQEFIKINKIEIGNILTIKKDAIFLINTNVRVLKVLNDFQFVKKNTFSSYMNLEKKEFYLDSINRELHVKGLNQEAVELQKRYLLNDIKLFMLSAERLKDEEMFDLLLNYRSRYLNKKLSIETYRNLEDGRYHIDKYLIQDIDSEMLDRIDISQNYVKYILPMIKNII